VKQLVALCTLICVYTPAVAEPPNAIDLGGPRKVMATVTEAGEWYDINVSLIPVRCFDSSMNQRLSQEKARSYAIEALFHHVGSSKRQSATISNAEIIKAQLIDARFVMILRVPRKGVHLAKMTDTKISVKTHKGTTRRSLLKVKDDYQETLKVVAKTFAEDLPMFDGNLAEFYEAVSSAEELGVNRLASLEKEIEADRWLLSTDREGLLRAVAVEEERFLTHLLKQVKEVESNVKGDE
jgi:hypothetical protein